jgi:hypothetical protein
MGDRTVSEENLQKIIRIFIEIQFLTGANKPSDLINVAFIGTYENPNKSKVFSLNQGLKLLVRWVDASALL